MNGIYHELSGTIAEDRERDNMRAMIAQQSAMIDYLSMMADIELPTGDGMEEGMEYESEI